MFDCMCYIYLSVANYDGVQNRQTMAAGSLAGYQWFHRDTTVVHNGSTGIPMVAQGYHIFNKFCTLSESFGKWWMQLGDSWCQIRRFNMINSPWQVCISEVPSGQILLNQKSVLLTTLKSLSSCQVLTDLRLTNLSAVLQKLLSERLQAHYSANLVEHVIEKITTLIDSLVAGWASQFVLLFTPSYLSKTYVKHVFLWLNKDTPYCQNLFVLSEDTPTKSL